VRIAADREQTVGVRLVNETVRPELTVAERAMGTVLNGTVGKAAKLIVCAARLTVKLWVTGGAAAKLPLPFWLAWTEQIPPEMMARVVPVAAQTAGVEVAKATGRPEEEVAESVMGETPKVTLKSGPKVIVWVPWLMENDLSTKLASRKFALPICVALTEQVPTASKLRILPETVQTLGVIEVKATVSPEVAKAESATEPEEREREDRAANVMVWVDFVISKVWKAVASL